MMDGERAGGSEGAWNSSFFLFFIFLRLHSWPMEVPKLGVELEL